MGQYGGKRMERRRRRSHQRHSSTPRREIWIFSIGAFAFASLLVSWIVYLSLPSRGVIDVAGVADTEGILPLDESNVLLPTETVSRGLMKDLADLPLRARPERYRELANDAEREAERASGSIRTSYQRIAEQWRALASAIDAAPKDEASNELK